MKTTLANLLVVLGLAAGVVLLAITMGLFPAPEPEPIDAVPLVVPPRVATAKPAAKPSSPVPRVGALALCAAPAEGSRLHVVAEAAGAPTMFVWCRGGYALFSLDGTGPTPLVTKLAHLPTNMPRPGGALRADVTADGVPDIVVGVAPQDGVVHAPGSGVFLAKGRAQGGYEAASALLEMPVVALTLAPNLAQPAARDLFVVTRGDAAARRPGQLAWFEAGPTPLKKATFNAGLVPRDVRVAQLRDDLALQVLVLASEPGRAIALSPQKQPAEAAQEVALPEVVAWCAAHDARFVLARTTGDLWQLQATESLGVERWFAEANVGACATGDLDRDGTPDALAVTDAGVIWLRDASATGTHELTFPAGYRALDVAYVAGETPRVVALALDVAREQLVLLVWPKAPWVDGKLEFVVEPARDAAAAAEIPLE